VATKYVFVVGRGSDLSYDKRVGIASPESDAVHVRIVDRDRPGAIRVKIVRYDPDEYMVFENPGELPFDTKLDLLGLPPCPRCGGRFYGQIWGGAWSCPMCGNWSYVELFSHYRGQMWRPEPM
jgi:hypothetical protein